jgi:hypothetical protein
MSMGEERLGSVAGEQAPEGARSQLGHSCLSAGSFLARFNFGQH